MNNKTPCYHAYLLRFWQEDQSASWRVTLENPHTGEILGFPSMEALYLYLNEQTWGKTAMAVQPPEG